MLHIVGPIIEGQLQPHRQAALANSYRSCLDLAREIGSIRSVALCAISTRVFGSPKRGAAEIAARTVGSSPRDKSSVMNLVVFDLFTDKGREVYDSLLR